MSQLVTTCPRCDAKDITFDLIASVFIRREHGWQSWEEAFCKCRNCSKTTVFVLSQSDSADYAKNAFRNGLENLNATVNNAADVQGYISLKDRAATPPPEHLPSDIEPTFTEGATCMAVGCPNAAATMFRLCVDLATRAALPTEEVEGLNRHTREHLGPRITWLFDNAILPDALRDLSSCIKDDGNDGAHQGNLTIDDARDLLDFTNLLLERLYTEPKRLELAQTRRNERNATT